MIVRNVARGRSFTKLAAYLTSPKDGQHRALWHSIENVGATEPRTAAKIMAAVDLHADELKAAAGVKAGGRKAKDGPVYHVVMSWAEGQQPERDHQLQAARDMLETIGLDRAQALIVAHDDNGKSHLHIMLNLVDPETGKRLSLSNDRHRMQEWALAYERANGGVIIERRADNAERWAKGEAQDKAERIPRAAMDKAERAQRRAWGEEKAARDEAFKRQQGERAAMRADHGEQWKAAKAEAAAHRAAYKAAFRAAYAREKAAAKIEHKPTWKAVFQRQKAERGGMDRHTAQLREQAERARREAQKAERALATAQRRSGSLLGKLSQRIGLVMTTEQAAAYQGRAASAMERAALELAQAELAKAGLAAKQEAERRAIGKQISEGTFARAQLAVDEMPRADFSAIIRAQDAERAAMIERQNAERAALGMKPYEPRQHGAAAMSPLEQMKPREDQTRDAFAAASPPKDRREPPAPDKPLVQGARPQPSPQGLSRGTTPAAPDAQAIQHREQQREAAEKTAAERTTFTPADLRRDREGDVPLKFERKAADTSKTLSAFENAAQDNREPAKPRTLAELKAQRAEQGTAPNVDQQAKAAADFAKARREAEQRQKLDRDRDRDDFER